VSQNVPPGPTAPGQPGADGSKSGSDPNDLFHWCQAAPVRTRDRLLLAVLVGAGILSAVRFADWWFAPAHVAQPALFVVLSLALWYGMARMILGWVNLLGIRRPEHSEPHEGLSVAIFTTSTPGEPLGMFETTLAACAGVLYPHTTYLLDDTRDPRFREVARRHGAVHMELVGLPGAKAGKINAALARTAEDFVLVLDPDHIPFPHFLHRVLGHFRDPRVGFVQVAQAYYNQRRSFTARGAAEQTYTFYGPTQMGLFGHGGPVAIGANCTFRRQALDAVAGHGIGLAEDLVTSIRIHAAGWRSVYLPEVVSRGLVPEDLGSFYRQQIKWARGVWEVLFAELPRAFRGLSCRQRLSYLAIGTYYLGGLTTAMYLLLPYLYLWTGLQPASMPFAEFVTVGGPVALLGVAIYLLAQRWLCHPPAERGLHWRGLSLKIACWPIYLFGTVLAIFRVNVPYIPTAKEAVRGRFLRLAWPHLALAGLYALTLAWTLYNRLVLTPESALVLSSEAVWGMVAFASTALLMASGGIVGAWEARRPPERRPWENLRLQEILADGAGTMPPVAPEAP
jgi:cellulose synthase (UDP-forming)